MGGDLVGDYEAMQAGGTTVRSAGYGLPDTCPGDSTGNGSQAIEFATQDFAMRISVALRGIEVEATQLGQLAIDSAATLRAADAALTGGA